jgi:hypothetical protein
VKTAIHLLAAALLLWSTTSPGATGALFVSEPGEFIGQGQTRTFDDVRVSAGQSNALIIFGAFRAEISVPIGHTIAAGGRFGGAGRFSYTPASQPGLSVTGEARGCNQSTGWFHIREALYSSNGDLARVAIDFKQKCDANPFALYGALRYNSEVPLEIPAIAAIAGARQWVHGRDVVVLDGSYSFAHAPGGTSMQYRWEQLRGMPVEMRGADSAVVDFVAPLVAPGGEELEFELRTIAGGLADVDTVIVNVATRSDPQTWVILRSEPGDYVGGGRITRELRPSAFISARHNDRGGATIGVEGYTWWGLQFGPPLGVPFLPGSYEDAERFSFAAPDRPAMEVYGEGRGCNQLAGRFDLIELMTDISGVNSMALDFEQRCEVTGAPLRGEVRYQYIEPNPPIADAGPDQTANSGVNVVLDGRGSTDDTGIALYQWRQVQGPAATIVGSDAAQAHFLAPHVSQPTELRFRLLVADSGDLTAADTVTVTVNPSATPPPPPGNDADNGGGGGGGAIPPLTLFALLLVVLGGRLTVDRKPH